MKANNAKTRGAASGLSVEPLRRTFVVLLIGLFCGCAAPIGVVKLDAQTAQMDLTASILTSGQLSEKARILLRRANREDAWKQDPETVLADFHASLARSATSFNAEVRAEFLDAVAELNFAHAVETKDRRFYLAAALYAWSYLFPDDEALFPAQVERGVRLSTDIYNRSVTLALTDPETGEVVLEDGEHEMPFGTLTIDFDEKGRSWGDRDLTRFASLADLGVRGLNNRYRVSGIGAPLAASLSENPDPSDQNLIFEKVRVPISALLRFDEPEARFGRGTYDANLSVHVYSADESVEIAGRELPLEVEPSAALALQLTEAAPWKNEIRGFFQGDLAMSQPGITSLMPYQAGRIPVVLVHGTASSAGRWADLLNDLQSDPVLRRHYQVWLFNYNTGSPIPYSGWLLRKGISDVVQSLDPEGRDAALRDMVVMGHSQGGLLTKLLVVDAGQSFWNLVIDEPPEEVELEPENRELLEGSLLVEPSANVGRVIFLSTPHHGSRLATLGPARLLGRMVRAPANVVTAVGELFDDDAEAEVQRRLSRGGGAIGNMSPGSAFIQTLAAMPIAPGVHAHSIIGVKKGPKEAGGDGVVSYQSAHLDDVESERVVKSGHSSQSNPLVVSEVRRILIEHLADAIDRKIVEPVGLPPAD